MNTVRRSMILIAGLLLFSSPALAEDVDGILSLDPVGSATCLSVTLDLPAGPALSGLSWYNNDGTLPFPRLFLMEAEPGLPPDLRDTGMLLQEVTGETLAWGEVHLTQPVTSSTGLIHVVFLFPDSEQMTAEGASGGPGIGYRLSDSSRPCYISPDGLEWVAIEKDYDLALEPEYALGKVVTQTASLADLGDRLDLSGLPAAIEDHPLPQQTRLVQAVPNPFNPSTEIQFDLAQAAPTTLEVYNVRGQRIRVLHQGYLPAGEHRVTWLGDDATGATVSSGVYVVRMRAGGHQQEVRVTLLK